MTDEVDRFRERMRQADEDGELSSELVQHLEERKAEERMPLSQRFPRVVMVGKFVLAVASVAALWLALTRLV